MTSGGTARLLQANEGGVKFFRAASQPFGVRVVTVAPPRKGFSLAELAVLAMALGAAVLALIPVALEYFGSDWRVSHPEREAVNCGRTREVGVGAR